MKLDIIIQQILETIGVLIVGFFIIQGVIRTHLEFKEIKKDLLKYKADHYKLKKQLLEAKDKYNDAKTYYKDMEYKRKNDNQISLFDLEGEHNDEGTNN